MMGIDINHRKSVLKKKSNDLNNLRERIWSTEIYVEQISHIEIEFLFRTVCYSDVSDSQSSKYYPLFSCR